MRGGWRIAGSTSLMLCGLSLLLLWLSHRPLWHTDLWGHLSYGRWIWQHQTLPATEPLIPLAAGVPVIDTAWLSQLIAYGLYERFGPASIQFLYALSLTLSAGMLVFGVRTKSGSVTAGLLAALIFGGVNQQQLLIVRPQLLGLVCFVALFVWLASSRWQRWVWIAVPMLFCLWANLHGSVIVGLLMLATFAAGRGLDVLRRTGRLSRVFADQRVRRLLVLLGLSTAATLVNPYGVNLYRAIFAITDNANVRDLIEWQPLTWHMRQGRAAYLAAALLLLCWIRTPRRITSAEVLLSVGLGGAALWSSRMIHWWAPVVGYWIAVHVAACVRQWSSQRVRAASVAPNGWWTAFAVISAVICLMATPLAQSLLFPSASTAAAAQQLRHSVSPGTPLDVAEYLGEHPPQGLVFNTFEWGDYLLWAGPPSLRVFAASHVHLLPEPVWRDYLTIARAESGWQDLLEHYEVTTLMLDSRLHRRLLGKLTDIGQKWQICWREGSSVVVSRERCR